MPKNMCIEPQLITEDLGLTGYADTLALQRSLQQRMIDAKRAGDTVPPGHLLLVEHLPVITLGRHARRENVLFSAESLKSRGVEIYDIERGGDVTYHGPGQLVAYLVIDLEAYRLGVKKFVDIMEEAVIRTINDFGISGGRVDGATGVWIDTGTARERKICAIGIKCSRFVTMHGLALNVNTDLDGFRLINPCGFVDKGVTSMASELGREIPIVEVKQALDYNLRELLRSQPLRKGV